MAKNRQAQDAAAKAKKQKMMLVVFGVGLLAVGVLQGPKLLKQLNPPAPEAAAVVDGSTAVPPAATPGQTPTIVQVQPAAPQRTAILAGVTLSSDSLPAADDDQLRSFSLFVVKDPFVQQSSEEEASATPAPTAVPPPAAATTDTTAADAAKASTPPPPTPTDATITMNGQAYALTVKDAFPKNDPLFVLARAEAQAREDRGRRRLLRRRQDDPAQARQAGHARERRHRRPLLDQARLPGRRAGEDAELHPDGRLVVVASQGSPQLRR